MDILLSSSLSYQFIKTANSILDIISISNEVKTGYTLSLTGISDGKAIIESYSPDAFRRSYFLSFDLQTFTVTRLNSGYGLFLFSSFFS